MAKLPFKTAPRQQLKIVGTDNGGTIEIPSYGGLLIGEERLLAEVKNFSQESFQAIARLCRRIEQEQGVSLTEAYDALMGSTGEGGDRLGLRLRYADDLIELNRKTESNAVKEKEVVVTAIIRYRLEPAWTEEDTKALHSELFQAIFEFAEEEQGKTKSVPSDRAEDSLEGNSEPQSDGGDPIPLTGRESSGESNGASLTTEDSAIVASIASPVG